MHFFERNFFLCNIRWIDFCVHKLCLHEIFLHYLFLLFFYWYIYTVLLVIAKTFFPVNDFCVIFVLIDYFLIFCPYHFLFKNWRTFSPGWIPASVNWACTGMSIFVDSKMSNNLSVVVLATIWPVMATTLSFVDLFSVIIRKKFLSTIVSSVVLTLSRSKIKTF